MISRSRLKKRAVSTTGIIPTNHVASLTAFVFYYLFYKKSLFVSLSSAPLNIIMSFTFATSVLLPFLLFFFFFVIFIFIYFCFFSFPSVCLHQYSYATPPSFRYHRHHNSNTHIHTPLPHQSSPNLPFFLPSSHSLCHISLFSYFFSSPPIFKTSVFFPVRCFTSVAPQRVALLVGVTTKPAFLIVCPTLALPTPSRLRFYIRHT